jgi:hypothetical protein
MNRLDKLILRVLDFAWRTTGGPEGNQRMGWKVHWIDFYIHTCYIFTYSCLIPSPSFHLKIRSCSEYFYKDVGLKCITIS